MTPAGIRVAPRSPSASPLQLALLYMRTAIFDVIPGRVCSAPTSRQSHINNLSGKPGKSIACFPCEPNGTLTTFWQLPRPPCPGCHCPNFWSL